MQWFYLALGSTLFFTTLSLLQRVIAVDSKYPRATTFVYNLAAAVISVIYFFFSSGYKNFVFPQQKIAYLFLFVACLGYGLFERIRFVISKQLDASLNSIVGNVGIMIAVVVAAILYAETITIYKVAGSLLIIAALVLVSFHFKKHFKGSLKAIMLGILGSTFLGIGWALDKKGALYFNIDMYNILVWTLPLIIIFLPRINFSEIKIEAKLASWKIVLMAALNVIGYIMQLKAMTMADATKVILIVQTSALLTVIAGIVILKEREGLVRKMFAGILAILGVYLLLI